MNWVSIDKEKCSECGLCAIRCPRCFIFQENSITAHADPDNCILCGHCIAICPTNAINHSQLNMEYFQEVDDNVLIGTDEFIRFLKRRRSHRHFKEKIIPQEDLKTLVDLCRFVPTGSNRQTIEIMVVQNKEKIRKLSDLTVDFFQKMVAEIEIKVDRLRIEGRKIPADLQAALERLPFRKRLARARESGLDPVFYKAPLLMIFHSQIQPSTPKDDCVIAAHTVALTAMTMGLETCYIGLFEKAAHQYPPIQQELALPKNHKVFSTLIMGYPKLSFLRTVERNPIKVRWV